MKKLLLYALLIVSAAVNAADFWPASCLQPISIGQTIEGQISTTSDCYWWGSDPNGKWYTDPYTFAGTAGQQIAITMNGVGSFDPDLTLFFGNSGANADKIVYDNNGGGGVNARIPPTSGYITLASTGTYVIWASALLTNTGGSYSLTLSSDTSGTGPGATTDVIEFFHAGLDHYFITAGAAEAAAIDNGSAGPGWARTGGTFKSGGSASVCRFYGSQSPGPNSHFYTVISSECDALKQLQATTPATQKRWNFEGLDFRSTPPVAGSCPSGTIPVYRAYNNGSTRGIDSNHRISANQSDVQQTTARGWAYEGVVMCAPPSTGGSVTGSFTSNTGGVMSAPGGQKLEVPPGAIPLNASGQAATVTFSAETVSSPPKPLPTGVSGVGQVTKFGPDGFNFAWPLTTTLPIPSSATSLTGMQYRRFLPATSTWVSYPGIALATDTANKVIGASVTSYDLGYDTLTMLNAVPAGTALDAEDRLALILDPVAAEQDKLRNASGLTTAANPGADLKELRLGSECTTCDGAMKWQGENCLQGGAGGQPWATNYGAECHFYFVAKNYKPRAEWQRTQFAEFLTYWYNGGNGCLWNAGTLRFEAVAGGNCGTFRTGSSPTGDPAPSTIFAISQGDWEFCVTESQYVIPGASLPIPGKWTYSALVPVSITQASHNTCQVSSCWSPVVPITVPLGSEWKEPAQMTACPASTSATTPVGTGVFQATLTWVNASTQTNGDLDLHLYGPNGIHVYYPSASQLSPDGSLRLDRDWTSAVGNAVENIFSTGTAPMPAGDYRLTVLFYSDYGHGPKSYSVRTIHSGVAKTYTGTLTTVKQEVEIERFTK